MNKEYNKNTENQAPKQKKRRRTRAELFNRTREERSLDYGSRRWGIPKKFRDQLEATYPNRNGMNYLISIIDSPCNNSLVRKEDIYINNLPEGAIIPEKKEHKGDGLFQVTLKASVVLVKRKDFKDYGPRQLAAPRLEVRKIVRKHGINKPFSEFDPWDWPIWRKNRQEYWKNQQEQLLRELGYAQERRNPKPQPALIFPEANYVGNSRIKAWIRDNYKVA